VTDQVDADQTTADQTTTEPQKVTRAVLTAMVVGSMVGAGVFSLPARFGIATGVAGALIAWIVAGAGMLMLAFVFQTLAIRKPHLDSGVFIYAKAGFGDYMGFNSAIGFWASACAGNTFYWVFMTATIGAFFPQLGDGDTLLAVGISTLGVWLFHYLIARGVRDAAIIDHHHLQDLADHHLHRRPGVRVRPARVRRQLLCLRPGDDDPASQEHHDHHHLRVHRDRRSKRLLAVRPEARARRRWGYVSHPISSRCSPFSLRGQHRTRTVRHASTH